ncbi:MULTISPECIES: transcriptional regulator HexR [unclassified Salinicola]|uniref:transcriptional regulator HexR n=1 Tax=unclassified Salinicola TaxID=2634022 RepID=UPI001A8D4239|nr:MULTISPECIES: transcriptional regulator HexR [unclassified Salinicola]MCE3028329.1 transcriptional regulator HexR [Salinicola sp. DM10]WIX33674.1 transcriptional regulator HexR [Salinicola sp. JS01]
MANHDLIARIRTRIDELNRSERKVADVILRDPDAAIGMSIATLAQAATVSEPTVNRFCRNFDTKGYPDFKIQLAQSLAGGTPYVSRSVESDDDAGAYTDKIIGATIAALDEARRTVDPKRIERVVDHLSQARQINFFALGASAPAAFDAHNKFFRFNLPVAAHNDVLTQRMIAAAAHTGDVIVVISYTGRTRELVEVAQLASESGATVIGITRESSPLAEVCTDLLPVDLAEDTEVYMPMASRMIHMALIDVLATGVTLRRGKSFLPHLRKIKESLRPTKFPPAKE